jgi:hypothetical protein
MHCQADFNAYARSASQSRRAVNGISVAPYLAIGLIEVERRAFDLIVNNLHHIGIRRVGFGRHDIGIASLQAIGQCQCHDAFTHTALAATNDISGLDRRMHRLPLQIVSIRFDALEEVPLGDATLAFAVRV